MSSLTFLQIYSQMISRNWILMKPIWTVIDIVWLYISFILPRNKFSSSASTSTKYRPRQRGCFQEEAKGEEKRSECNHSHLIHPFLTHRFAVDVFWSGTKSLWTLGRDSIRMDFRPGNDERTGDAIFGPYPRLGVDSSSHRTSSMSRWNDSVEWKGDETNSSVFVDR